MMTEHDRDWAAANAELMAEITRLEQKVKALEAQAPDLPIFKTLDHPRYNATLVTCPSCNNTGIKREAITLTRIGKWHVVVKKELCQCPNGQEYHRHVAENLKRTSTEEASTLPGA